MKCTRIAIAAAALLASAVAYSQCGTAQEVTRTDDFAGMLSTLTVAEVDSDFASAAQVLRQVGACRLQDFDQFLITHSDRSRLAVEFLASDQLKVTLLRTHTYGSGYSSAEENAQTTTYAKSNQPFVTVTLNACGAAR